MLSLALIFWKDLIILNTYYGPFNRFNIGKTRVVYIHKYIGQGASSCCNS